MGNGLGAVWRRRGTAELMQLLTLVGPCGIGWQMGDGPSRAGLVILILGPHASGAATSARCVECEWVGLCYGKSQKPCRVGDLHVAAP